MNRIITIPIFLLVLFLLVVYGLLPRYSQFNQLNESISLQEKQLSQAQQDLIVLEQAAQVLDGSQENWEKIESALPQDFSLASLLYYLDEQAVANGLILESIGQADSSSQKPSARSGSGQDEDSARIKEAVLSITVIGAVSSLESFLRNIEKSSRLIWVESINTNEAEGGLLRFALNLKVFHY